MHTVSIFAIALVYLALLFGIAYLGDAHKQWLSSERSRAWTYSLALAVYATSWTFYGAVGRASWDGFGYLPIYLGPIVLFLFGHKFLSKLIRVSKKQHITSIADFLASRYGKSQKLAILVTLIATIGIIPYISLQLKAVALSFSLATSQQLTLVKSANPLTDSAFYVALMLGIFTIMFGAEHLDAKQHRHGLIKAIAFESIVKIVAFVTVGTFIVYGYFSGFGSVVEQVQTDPAINVMFNDSPRWPSFITQFVLASLAMVCLPRQFHVLVVENTQKKDIKTARWVLPAYLAIISLFVIPIAAAGKQLFAGSHVNPDAYVLTIPLFLGQDGITMLVFLGGIAAATGMMIVSTVTLATMVSNEILLPLLLTLKSQRWLQPNSLGALLFSLRKLTILGILTLAYIYYHFVSGFESLTSIGLISFAAVAQFAPAIIGGLYWRRGNQLGAITGLCAGFFFWMYTLLLPAMANAGWINHNILDQELLTLNWLSNGNVPEPIAFDPITYGTWWCLAVNIFFYVGVSLISRQTAGERRQARLFVDTPQEWSETGSNEIYNMPPAYRVLGQVERFFGKDRVNQALADYERETGIKILPNELCSPRFLDFMENQLAGVIGSSTARLVIESSFEDKQDRLIDVADIVDEASQAVQFNRELLKNSIENLSQGVRVTDVDHKVVAWNQRYIELMDFPQELVRVGIPLADLSRFNLKRAGFPEAQIEEEIEHRMAALYDGHPYAYDRVNPNGQVMEVVGNPLPDGGFVTTFTDITERIKAEQALKDSNIELESRVQKRTEELSQLNEQLLAAKETADNANQSKTRFLASASHDLLQPLNAARLFSSALIQQLPDDKAGLAKNIDGSLTAAEEILSTILDISKMDAGAIEPQVTDFALSDLFNNLTAEFTAIAENKGLQLDAIPTHSFVRSDQQLLRRLVQNFLSNAIRYTQSGRVLLGCRRRTDYLLIQVWDTGPGIPDQQKNRIFEEFKRFSQGDTTKGLGLGLAIVDRISHVLNHPIFVDSVPGKGSVFSVAVPYGQEPEKTPVAAAPMSLGLCNLEGIRVLCIDNEQPILDGMKALFAGWGCKVECALNQTDAVTNWSQDKPPQLVLIDYQLDNDATGIDALTHCREHWQVSIPGVLITANKSDEVKAAAKQAGCPILYKPVKPAALRALLSKIAANFDSNQSP